MGRDEEHPRTRTRGIDEKGSTKDHCRPGIQPIDYLDTIKNTSGVGRPARGAVHFQDAERFLFNLGEEWCAKAKCTEGLCCGKTEN